jgi:hypothetical protein
MTSWVWIVLGSLAIGLGGFAVTLGWDLRSSAANKRMLQLRWDEERLRQRAAMQQTLSAELTYNQATVQRDEYTKTDEASLKAQKLYPGLTMGGIQIVVASGLFIPPDDTELFEALNSAVRNIENWNRILDVANNQIASPISIEGYVSRLNSGLRSGPALKDLRATLANLESTLALYTPEGRKR